MFVDASAIIQLLGREQGYELTAHKLQQAKRLFVSPTVAWESTVGLVRSHGLSVEDAESVVSELIAELKANVVAIDAKVGRLAIEAYRLYGKGRHPASLNFGDCFAYACAKSHRLPLLYIGNDFSQTDLA